MDDIIRKIEALMNKSESSEHQAERDAFMSKALELAMKYGIEEHELRKDRSISEKPIAKDFRVSSPYPKVKRQLLQQIALSQSCTILVYSRQANRAILVGYKSDIEVVEFLYQMMIRQAVSEMFKACEKANNSSRLFKSSFLLGFALGVGELLTSLVKTYNSLVLSRKTEVEKLASELATSKSKRTSSSNVDYSAYQRGRQSGTSADIGAKGITGKMQAIGA